MVTLLISWKLYSRSNGSFVPPLLQIATGRAQINRRAIVNWEWAFAVQDKGHGPAALSRAPEMILNIFPKFLGF